MEENDKSKRDKNFEKAALLVAVLLGMTYKSYEELAAVPVDLKKVIVKIHESPDMLKDIQQDKIVKKSVLKEDAIEAVLPKSKYMRINTAGDATVCEKCAPWQGKIICIDGTDNRYPSLDDYINSGAFHINCKCALLEILTDEIPLKSDLNPRYAGRKAARPDLYNRSAKTKGKVVFSNCYFKL